MSSVRTDEKTSRTARTGTLNEDHTVVEPRKNGALGEGAGLPLQR